MNWFGKKKKAQPSTTSSGTSSSGGAPANPAATVVKLRTAIEAQEKREDHLQLKIDKIVVDAKAKMAKGDKKGALFLMKRKKLHEQEMDKIGNVKMTLETQCMQLESAAQNAETFQAMNAGKNAMTKINNEVGIDKVDDMMDDIRDQIDQGNEISNAMAQTVDPMLADEDELLAELNNLEADSLEAELLKPNQNDDIALPDVPDAKLPALNNAEAEEMKKLEAELAGL